ncbi:AraC family transcriptional regulator [Clostridium sp. MSJ-4]|uniref:AraC family transcriptional regulator n=1 Tax=Clostridium simiarum TaxID=2841506 RepID=A0ABS6F2U7_9CLOT|nr:AraC family transcriptional regulator [Clostridium simiarum]MBU5592631.1 AraC family transcriptional regulator [Clostridium simiarum]
MSYLPLKFEDSNIFSKKSIAIRPDVYIMVSDGILQNKIQRKSETTAPIFELSYSRNNAMYGEVDRTLIELRPGYASLGFSEQAICHSEYNRGDDIKLYSIWVSPCAFDGFCKAVYGKSNVGFRSFQKGAYYSCDFKNDAQEESLINKLDSCFEKGSDKLNRLLLESYILELLSMNIERLLCKDSFDNRFSEISKSDIERLTYTREVLLNRLETPPTLLELSRIIQMNDYKLKRLFKLYFGKTVYEFIREQRLEKAFSLLQGGNYNVSQTAFAVGYTNISHFSSAFQKRFGITPRALMKTGRFIT